MTPHTDTDNSIAASRGQFATRFAVIAATVGSAVGLGNIWRFPYEAGTHGGGAFMLLYIAFIFIIGVPVLTAEFIIADPHDPTSSAPTALLPPADHGI